MMRKLFLGTVLLAGWVLFALAAAGETKLLESGRPVELQAGKTNMLVKGEKAFLATGPVLKGLKIDCEVEGEAIKLTDRSGDDKEGYTFTFEAVKSGKAAVIKKSGPAGADSAALKTRIETEVLTLDQVPAVKIEDLQKDPGSYKDRVFKISGMGRGWGLPAKAKQIWGQLVTKSDWVLEDDTGAVYVTGMIITDVAPLLLVADLFQVEGKWAVWARQAYEQEAGEPGAAPKDYVDLVEDKENMLKVGQVGRVVLNLSKSEVAEFKIEGDAVTRMDVMSLDYFFKARMEGQAVINVYIRNFYDLPLELAPEEGAPPKEQKPAKVFKVKVEKP